MFFSVHPHAVFYAYTCTFGMAVVLRILWPLFAYSIIVKRLNFKRHHFNYLNEVDRYKNLDNFKHLAGQAMNVRIKISLFNVEFIDGDALVTHLIVTFVLLNRAAKHVEMTGKVDTEDCGLAKTFKKPHDCTCIT